MAFMCLNYYILFEYSYTRHTIYTHEYTCITKQNQTAHMKNEKPDGGRVSESSSADITYIEQAETVMVENHASLCVGYCAFLLHWKGKGTNIFCAGYKCCFFRRNDVIVCRHSTSADKYAYVYKPYIRCEAA